MQPPTCGMAAASRATYALMSRRRCSSARTVASTASTSAANSARVVSAWQVWLRAAVRAAGRREKQHAGPQAGPCCGRCSPSTLNRVASLSSATCSLKLATTASKLPAAGSMVCWAGRKEAWGRRKPSLSVGGGGRRRRPAVSGSCWQLLAVRAPRSVSGHSKGPNAPRSPARLQEPAAAARGPGRALRVAHRPAELTKVLTSPCRLQTAMGGEAGARPPLEMAAAALGWRHLATAAVPPLVLRPKGVWMLMLLSEAC